MKSSNKTLSHPMQFCYKGRNINHCIYSLWEAPTTTPSVLHIYSSIVIDNKTNNTLLLRSLTHNEYKRRRGEFELTYEILDNNISCVFNRDVSGFIMDQWQLKIEEGNWSKPFNIKPQTINLRVLIYYIQLKYNDSDLYTSVFLQIKRIVKENLSTIVL